MRVDFDVADVDATNVYDHNRSGWLRLALAVANLTGLNRTNTERNTRTTSAATLQVDPVAQGLPVYMPRRPITSLLGLLTMSRIDNRYGWDRHEGGYDRLVDGLYNGCTFYWRRAKSIIARLDIEGESVATAIGGSLISWIVATSYATHSIVRRAFNGRHRVIRAPLNLLAMTSAKLTAQLTGQVLRSCI